MCMSLQKVHLGCQGLRGLRGSKKKEERHPVPMWLSLPLCALTVI